RREIARADLRHVLALDQDVAARRRRAGAVEDACVADQEAHRNTSTPWLHVSSPRLISKRTFVSLRTMDTSSTSPGRSASRNLSRRIALAAARSGHARRTCRYTSGSSCATPGTIGCPG